MKYLKDKNVIPSPEARRKAAAVAAVSNKKGEKTIQLPRPDSREKINIERFFAVGALKKKNALQAASPRKSPMSKSRRAANATPNANLDDLLIRNLNQDFHTRSRSLLPSNQDLDLLQFEEQKE